MTTSKINMSINNATLYRASIKNTDVTIKTITDLITDENKLGLGKDSIKFEAVPSITEYEFAGKLDDSYKDMEEITGWEVALEGDILDLNEKFLQASLMEVVTDSDTGYKRYAPKERLSTADYNDLICVGEIKGKDKFVVIVVYNCFNEAGLSIEFKDKENNSASLTFKGKKELGTKKKPFEVLIPA